MRRAAGCLVALALVPVGLAAAGAGYLALDRANGGAWAGALGWFALTAILGIVGLALSGLAQSLLSPRRADDDRPSATRRQ